MACNFSRGKQLVELSKTNSQTMIAHGSAYTVNITNDHNYMSKAELIKRKSKSSQCNYNSVQVENVFSEE